MLANDVSRLQAIKARRTPDVDALCSAYLDEVAAKKVTETDREQAKLALEQYRTGVFPSYQQQVAQYLARFSAGFRIEGVAAVNTRGGIACNYNVVINNTPIAVGATATEGRPSFRNTLSSGDRNTLALSFFFASLDQDGGLANKVVVIDDPISSLDEHRSLTTVQEVRRLAERAGQVVVLSHNRGFLARIWEGADRTARAALQIRRAGDSSTIVAWDVDQDSITEHDRRHAALREYQASSTGNAREIAKAIRPVLEHFIRVAYPEEFPAGSLLGPFLGVCDQRLGTAAPVLNGADVAELRDLLEYANKFHHDTNTAWETEAINDGELHGYVRRALAFTKR
jgi:wobble nucleotide-excising tRNase